MAEKIEWIKTHCSCMDHGGCGAREDGQWKPVTWEKALDVICENMPGSRDEAIGTDV